MRGLRRHLGIVIVSLLAFVGCADQPPREATAIGNTSHLGQIIGDAMRVAGTPGAIVGIWADGHAYVRAFGVADKTTGEPMRTDDYSRIGSVTKTFTVTAILQLADQHRIRLEDPISKYVAAVPNGARITLRQLAQMQSCLPDYTDSRSFKRRLHDDPHHEFSPAELLAYSFAEPPLCDPGSGFRYSNTNAILLGLVVTKVSGQPLPRYIREHLLAPLGMTRTEFPTSSDLPSPHAHGYTNWTADGSVADATFWNPSWSWAAGAMISTVDDLHVWTVALATGTLLSRSMQQQRLRTIREVGVATEVGYGLGMFDIAGWLGHSGTMPGYGTVAAYLPARNMTMVILVNTDIRRRGIDPAMALASAVTKAVSPDHVYDLGV